MLEVAYEWRNEADYLVGSEAVAWSPTNDYNNILNHLAANANISMRDLAVYLVDDYIAVADLYNISDVTYSALSLGAEFDTLVSYFQTFATSLRKTNAHSQVVTAWNNTTSFEFDGDYHECRDLYDFAAELTTYVTSDEAVTQAAADLRTAIAGAVIHHQEKGKHAAAGTDPAYGLSILIPTHDEWTAYYAALYPTLALSVDTDWNEFITRLP